MQQLKLWTTGRERMAGVLVGDILPELHDRTFRFWMTTGEATRLIHRLHRRLPRGLVCCALVRMLPRLHGVTDDCGGLL